MWEKISYNHAILCPNIYNNQNYSISKNFDYEEYSYLKISIIKCDK
jgi:hypothetical protein